MSVTPSQPDLFDAPLRRYPIDPGVKCGRDTTVAAAKAMRGKHVVLRARQRVFCASLADWLDDEVPVEWLADLLALIHRTPNLDWLLLTKRPQNWRTRMDEVVRIEIPDGAAAVPRCTAAALAAAWLKGVAAANIWLGTTVEDQTLAEERIPVLLDIPAMVRFLSCEPLLGPVDLTTVRWNRGDGYFGDCLSPHHIPHGRIEDAPLIHWVICGGESGPNARPMHPDWARSLRDQCRAAGVPFFFKQWGEWCPGATFGGYPIRLENGDCYDVPDGDDPRVHRFQEMDDYGSFLGAVKVGKKAAGRLLDGREWNDLPGAATAVREGDAESAGVKLKRSAELSPVAGECRKGGAESPAPDAE